MLAALANQAQNYLVSGANPPRLGNAHPSIVPYDTFRTADGDIIIAVGNDGQFQRLCTVVRREKLGRDPRFATNQQRVLNRDELMRLLQAALSGDSSARWLERLAAVDIPAGPINTLAQAFADPNVVARQLRVDLPHPAFGSVPAVVNPIRMSATPPQYTRAPPLLGADTREVLSSLLALSAAEIDSLVASGVVVCR